MSQIPQDSPEIITTLREELSALMEETAHLLDGLAKARDRIGVILQRLQHGHGAGAPS